MFQFGKVASPETIGVLEDLKAVELAMRRLGHARLVREGEVNARDKEIELVQTLHRQKIAGAEADIALYNAQIEQYCRTHPEVFPRGKKSLQLQSGEMGLRLPPRPALVPLNDKWTWERIEAKLRELWKSKYFHKPKPPGPDKEKIKRLLSADELKQAGLKLDDTEVFYCEPVRLPAADQPAQVEAA